jgi:hypothetical protein
MLTAGVAAGLMILEWQNASLRNVESCSVLIVNALHSLFHQYLKTFASLGHCHDQLAFGGELFYHLCSFLEHSTCLATRIHQNNQLQYELLISSYAKSALELTIENLQHIEYENMDKAHLCLPMNLSRQLHLRSPA